MPDAAVMLKSQNARVRPVVRLPAWLVFIVFVPLQVWLFLKMRDAWGFWPTVGAFMLIGILAARAARAPWFQRLFFPQWAKTRERRRPVYSGILLLLAAVSFLLPWGPQPWLPAAVGVSLLKANVQ